jgi:hypothetical protein
MEQLVQSWFDKWTTGDFKDLPISNHFKHTSPYGTIDGKEVYEKLIADNVDQFLGHTFEIHDAFYGEENACVRYTAIKENFRLDVSEWYYCSKGKIDHIIAHYNIEGEISEDRKLKNLND